MLSHPAKLFGLYTTMDQDVATLTSSSYNSSLSNNASKAQGKGMNGAPNSISLPESPSPVLVEPMHSEPSKVSKTDKVLRLLLFVTLITSVLFYAFFAWQSKDYDKACKCIISGSFDFCDKYTRHGNEQLGIFE